MSQRNKLKFLWHSVSPFTRSGYGTVTKNILDRLVDYGYTPIMSAYYGVEPGGIVPYKYPILPSKEGPFGVQSAAKYARQFNVDASILFTDWWAFSDFPKLLPRPILYGPMDMIGYSEEILNFTKMYNKIVSLCKFQQNYLKSEGIESDMIYHGVDINKFKPLNKFECRKKWSIPDDTFVFGTVAANSDKEYRKGWAYSIKALHYFLESNPDVDRKKIKWLCHTVPNDQRGMPLISMVHKFGLDDIVKFMDPSQGDVMIPEEELIQLYNCFDVHLLPSRREGFGLTIIESEACGVPNISHNFSSMTELIEGHGWLCKSLGYDLNMETTPVNAETAAPDVYDLAEKIKDAYFNEDLRKKYGKASREFALKFNYDDLIVNQWIPFLDSLSDNKCIEDRRLL